MKPRMLARDSTTGFRTRQVRAAHTLSPHSYTIWSIVRAAAQVLDLYKQTSNAHVANPKAHARTAPANFPLFKLPRKLRDKIYHHALAHTLFHFTYTCAYQNNHIFADMVALYGDDPTKMTWSPQWLEAHPLLKKEATELFYPRADFFITGLSVESNPETDAAPIGRTSQERFTGKDVISRFPAGPMIQGMRSLTLVIDAMFREHCVNRIRGYRVFLRNICCAARSLEKLKIVFQDCEVCSRGFPSRGVDPEAAGLFGLLDEVSRTGWKLEIGIGGDGNREEGICDSLLKTTGAAF